jgi:hypothetical protein
MWNSYIFNPFFGTPFSGIISLKKFVNIICKFSMATTVYFRFQQGSVFIDKKYSGGSAKEWIENVAIPHIKSIVEKAKAQNISLDKVVNGK